jgi:hypothetical protein
MDGNLTYLEGLAQADPDTLVNLLETYFGWSDLTYSYGSEKIDGISKFDFGQFYDALDGEDPETFKAPILTEEPTWFIVSGTHLSATTEGGPFTILNGLLFPSGGEIFGGGSFISLGDGVNFYAEILNITVAKLGYTYEFDDDTEEHYHVYELSGGSIGAGITVIQVAAPDDATEWEDVDVNIFTL